MIFRILTTISIVIITSLSFAQSTGSDTLHSLNRSVSIIQEKLKLQDSIIGSLNDSNASIKKENELLVSALDVNTNIFNGLSTYFTIIAILISIIVLAIPLVNYFLVLKPNREAIDRMNKLEKSVPEKIETEFCDYMKGFEKKKAKEMIQSLSDPNNLPTVVDFFFLSSYSDFDHDDVSLVVDFLEKNKSVSDFNRSMLHSIIRTTPNVTTDLYYKRIVENSDRLNIEYAWKYFLADFEKSFDYVENVIIQDEHGHDLLLDLFKIVIDDYVGDPYLQIKTDASKEKGKAILLLLFNSEKICHSIGNYLLDSPRQNDITGSHISFNEFLKETLYIKSFYDENGRFKLSCSLDDK